MEGRVAGWIDWTEGGGGIRRRCVGTMPLTLKWEEAHSKCPLSLLIAHLILYVLLSRVVTLETSHVDRSALNVRPEEVVE
jgi:hypothetical protein